MKSTSLVFSTVSSPSTSHSEKMPSSSILERRWSLKSVALRTLKNLRSKSPSKGVELTVASNSLSLSNTRSYSHTTDPTDTFGHISTLSSIPIPPLTHTSRSSFHSPSSSHSPPLPISPHLLSHLPVSSHSQPASSSPHPPAPLSPSTSHLLTLPHPPSSSDLTSPTSHAPSPQPSSPRLPSPTPPLNQDTLTSRELKLELQRAEVLSQKRVAEALMHDTTKKVHTYQTEFEVSQRAFIKAVTLLHNLDVQLSSLRSGKEIDEEELFDTENRGDRDSHDGPLWYNPSTSDSDSETDSVW